MSPPVFPDIDTGALDKAVKNLGDQQSDLECQDSIVCASMEIVSASKVPWQSNAAKQWNAVANAYTDDLMTAATAFGNMATAISTLSTALKKAKSDYDTAKMKAGYISPFGGWQQYPPNPETDKQTNAALGDMQDAVNAANKALNAAAGDFSDITDATDNLNAAGWNGSQPQPPSGVDPNKYSSLNLLAIIFGSVIDNGRQGRSFEDSQLAKLGMSKNKIRFSVKGWPRSTIPDGIGDDDTFYEIKSNTTEIDYRAQIRLQMEYARRSGRSYRIIAREGTKITARMMKAIDGNPKADILYYNSKTGEYTSEKTGDTFKPSGKGGGLTRVSTGTGENDSNVEVGPPDKPGPVGGDPEGPEVTGGGGAGQDDTLPGGGSDEDPEPVEPEPIEPVEPIEPIEPIIP